MSVLISSTHDKYVRLYFNGEKLFSDSDNEVKGWQPPANYRYAAGDRYGLRQYMTISKILNISML